MSYTVQLRPAKRSNYHLPAEAKKYYGRYSRDGITVHWWNDPKLVKDSDHNNIVNYIYNKSGGSIHYVLSNTKITRMVAPENVAWHAQGGNPTTIGVEFSPHLNAEGYKKAGWLINDLEKQLKKGLKLYKHSHWIGTIRTKCPGTLDLNRMRKEADKWKRGDYNPKPKPPAKPKLSWSKLSKPTVYVCNKPTTNLWNFNSNNWDMKSVKKFKKGDRVTIYGKAINNTLEATYMLTEYSYTKKITNGFNIKDLDLFVPPTPLPKPPTPPKEQQDKPKPPNPPKPVEPTIEERLAIIETFISWLKALLSKIGIRS